MMLAHGPDASGYEKASRDDLKPVKLRETMAFMFETRFPQMPTSYAVSSGLLQQDYAECWSGLKKRFNGTPEGDWS
jgi:homogentisate 1,2-dioxygenase